MTLYTRKKILLIHSQQPANQYSGGAEGVIDSEQHWMRRSISAPSMAFISML